MILMRTIYLFFLASLLLFSCTDEVVEPETNHLIIKKELDIAYGNDPKQKMDIYYPEGYSQTTPVVFLLHGGGFIAGDKNEFSHVAQLFANNGFVAVNLSYRLVDSRGLDQNPPLHISSEIRVNHQVEDIDKAVEKFKNSSTDWGLGTSKMYMAGHSAGGTLAMLYVQGSKNEDIRASGNLAGLANMTLTEELFNNPPQHSHWPALKELLYRMSGAEVQENNALHLMSISPNWVLTKHAPGKPHITVMAKTNDQDLQFYPYYNTVQDAENFHNQLKGYGTPSSYILMDTDHGFGSHADDWKTAVSHVAHFFKQN